MNTNRYIAATLVVFIAVFALDFLVHGVMLKDAYTQTAHLWRPEEEANMLYMFASQLLSSAVLVFIFTRHYEGRGIGEGMRFGLMIGLFLAALELGAYCYMPIPMSLLLSWMAAVLAKGIVSGIVAAAIYRAKTV